MDRIFAFIRMNQQIITAVVGGALGLFGFLFSMAMFSAVGSIELARRAAERRYNLAAFALMVSLVWMAIKILSSALGHPLF